MGWLDKAKKLAEQAKEKAEEALAEVKARTDKGDGSPAPAGATAPPGPVDERMGTPYRPGMLGKPGWREQGLTDPAAILPVDDRDRAGIPHSTKSEIVEEPYGMGRRWTSGDRSAGLFYRLTAEHQAWLPPGGLSPDPDAGGALAADLEDGRRVIFLEGDGTEVVLETKGLDGPARGALASSVAIQLSA